MVCKNLHIMEFKKAIRNGGDPDRYSLRGERPLTRAIGQRDVTSFMHHIHSGADVNNNAEQSKPEQSLLWYSVLERKYDFTDILLRYGAKQTLYDKWSLMTYSINKENQQLLQCLLKYNVDVNEIDEHGNIPLELAVRLNHINIVKVLLDHGAEFAIQSAFMEAIHHDNLKMFELLTQRGADINFESITGFTPFTKATSLGCIVFVEEMLKRGVDDIDKLNPDGYTPLIDCIKAARWDLVELLVKHGAKVQLVDSHGNIPLAECLNAKYFPAMKLLVEAGAKWDKLRDRDGNSPLTLAIQMRHFDMLKFFLDHKANANELDDNHKSPLAVAIETDNIRFSKLLIEYGADTSVIFDRIKELAKTSDNWKRLFEEVVAEKKMSD